MASYAFMEDGGKVRRRIPHLWMVISIIVVAACISSQARAMDSELTRRTLEGIRGVTVVAEELQPNLQKFAQKAGLRKEQIVAEVEKTLKKGGIAIFTYDQWLKTKGRPFLHVVVNTHEYEKYWFAYDISQTDVH